MGHGVIMLKNLEEQLQKFPTAEREALQAFFHFFREETCLQMMSKTFFISNVTKAILINKFNMGTLFSHAHFDTSSTLTFGPQDAHPDFNNFNTRNSLNSLNSITRNTSEELSKKFPDEDKYR